MLNKQLGVGNQRFSMVAKLFRLSLQFIFILVVLFMVEGCYRKTRTKPASSDAILPYKVPGASDVSVIEVQDQLGKAGVKVITMGQDYLISIPSKQVFAKESPRLLWSSYGVLNNVACFLKQFRKVSVHVNAYSNKCASAQRELALTLARARQVAAYLESQDIDSRFIFTEGLGSDKPIVGFDKEGDESPNSRIEITFRDEVA